MEVLFATKNPAKVKKYKEGLEKKGIKLLTINDVNVDINIDESGKNCIENACLKAKAYYDATGIVSIGMDNTLFIEGFPDDKQPGTHVRRVNGKELTDEEMIEYYTSLVKEVGGKVTAKWVYGMAVYGDNIYETYTWNKDEFYLVDEVSSIRNPGYPLDSMSIDKRVNKYFVELTNEDKEYIEKEKLKDGNKDSDVINFIVESLKK